jgi:hypothetical protein
LEETPRARFFAGFLMRFVLGFVRFISEWGFGDILNRAPISRLVSRILSWLSVMPRIHFIGYNLPVSVRLTLPRNPWMVWKNSQTGLEGQTELQITDGNINAIMDINRFDRKTDLKFAINQAQDMADTIVNLLSLKTGNPFSAVLNKIIMPDGKIADTHLLETEYPKHITAFAEVDFEEVATIAMRDRNLSLALRDLTDVLRQSYTGTIGAARAIESIRNHFIPEGANRDRGWAPMHAALNATRPYVQSITDMSRGTRHGDWSTSHSEEEARKTTERAWILMNRFLEYRKRGDQPLPLSDFPLLELSQA